MKIAATIALVIAFSLPSVALADGYPFYHDTHEVIGDSLQLSLSESQVAEVSSTGVLTFTQKQRTLLQRFYANIPTKIRVISSTFNDGLDVREPNPVDCIWTSPAHVGITLREKYDEGEFTFETQADTWPLLRISPDGEIFSRGAKITTEDAEKLIQQAAHSGSDDEPPHVAITLPPPYREPDRADSNAAIFKVFDELVAIGKKHGRVVHRCW